MAWYKNVNTFQPWVADTSIWCDQLSKDRRGSVQIACGIVHSNLRLHENTLRFASGECEHSVPCVTVGRRVEAAQLENAIADRIEPWSSERGRPEAC